MKQKADQSNYNLVFSNLVLTHITGYVGLKFHNVCVNQDYIVIESCAKRCYGVCPKCAKKSYSVHSRYTRVLLDRPICGKKLSIKLTTRKFRCTNSKCSQSIFSEQLYGVTRRYGRKTLPALYSLQNMLIEMSSNKAALITSLLGIPQSSSTCLRIVKGITEKPIKKADIKHICVDDFAYKKGISYGTVVVDADTHQVLDVIEGRNKADVVDYLKEYCHAEIVVRDRSSSYSAAINEAIPNAQQVADRFHLVKNCNERIEVQIKSMYKSIIQELSKAAETNNIDITSNNHTSESIVHKVKAAPDIHPYTSDLSAKVETVYNEVQRLYGLGISNRKIARIVGLDKSTVNKYVQLNEPPRKYKVYKVDYNSRINIIEDGIDKGLCIKDIHKTVLNSGLKVALSSFYVWFAARYKNYTKQKQQMELANRETLIQSPFVKMFKSITYMKLNIYVCNPNYGINIKTGEIGKERIKFDQLIESSSILSSLRDACLTFRNAVGSDNVKGLDEWIDTYKESTYQELKKFCRGLVSDYNAIKNAILTPFSNGLVEGINNKIKAVKRSMYGRASNKLLKIKMLHACTG